MNRLDLDVAAAVADVLPVHVLTLSLEVVDDGREEVYQFDAVRGLHRDSLEQV
jgi:hypothetical protein